MAESNKNNMIGLYEIDRTIGRGNFANVKLARHRITKILVCLMLFVCQFYIFFICVYICFAYNIVSTHRYLTLLNLILIEFIATNFF